MRAPTPHLEGDSVPGKRRGAKGTYVVWAYFTVWSGHAAGQLWGKLDSIQSARPDPGGRMSGPKRARQGEPVPGPKAGLGLSALTEGERD